MSTPTDTKARITTLITEHLGVEQAKVTPEALLSTDLGADSLDQVELVMAVEEEFALEIPDEDSKQFRTVQDVITYVQSHAHA